MKTIKWLQRKLEEIYIPYPKEAFVEWWIENDLLPSENDIVKGRTTLSWSKEFPYKKCNQCRESKHITEYHTRASRCRRTGRLNIMASCKQCTWKAKTPATKRKVYKGNAETRGKSSKLVIMEYFGGCCQRCGYQGQPPQMDFDHKNPKEKLSSLSCMHLPHMSIKEIIIEIQKCQMLCSNCHRLVSTKYEHHLKDNITYHPMEEPILYAMSIAEEDREALRSDS